MWRRLVLLFLVLFVAASSATKGERKDKAVRRRTQGTVSEKTELPPKDPEDEKKEEKKDEKKAAKEKKEKKCKVKEPKEPKESKAPSTTPPPPPGPNDDPQVSVQATEDDASETTEGEDTMITGGDMLVSSSLPPPITGNATIDDEDLPYCTDEENSEGLSGDLSTTRGSKIGKAPIAAAALGLVTILLGFIGFKYYRDRRPVDNDGDKIAIANLY